MDAFRQLRVPHPIICVVSTVRARLHRERSERPERQAVPSGASLRLLWTAGRVMAMPTALRVVTGVRPRVRSDCMIFQAVATNATLNGNLSAFGALRSPATNSSTQPPNRKSRGFARRGNCPESGFDVGPRRPPHRGHEAPRNPIHSQLRWRFRSLARSGTDLSGLSRNGLDIVPSRPFRGARSPILGSPRSTENKSPTAIG